uniref:Uncharacterized protein n=1 Tax=Parascaris univalens TaxID=6257 RepID=A0A915ACD6_PARUN
DILIFLVNLFSQLFYAHFCDSTYVQHFSYPPLYAFIFSSFTRHLLFVGNDLHPSVEFRQTCVHQQRILPNIRGIWWSGVPCGDIFLRVENRGTVHSVMERTIRVEWRRSPIG